MKNPPHPGLSVRHDCIEPLGLTITVATERLGVSRKQLSDIVNARAGISPEMAIRLDKAFRGGAGPTATRSDGCGSRRLTTWRKRRGTRIGSRCGG
jgi:addiction module HigA family antidote